MRRAAALSFVLATAAAVAGEPPRPFVAGSHARILTAHAERPLVLAFWSLDCAYCLEELPQLAAWARRNPRAAVVLVSTDSPDDAAAIGATLAAHGFGEIESWVFADDVPERLRHEIDPRWRGELPHTVLRGRDGRLCTVTGRVKAEQLDSWLQSDANR